MATYYRDADRYDLALRANFQALKVRKALGDRREIGVALANVGLSYGYLGSYVKAAHYFERALGEIRQAQDWRNEGIVLGNIGWIHEKQGQWGRAIEPYRASLSIARQLKERGSEASTLVKLGSVLAETGQLDEGLQKVEEAITIAHNRGEVKMEGFSVLRRSRIYLLRGESQRALEGLPEVLSTARLSGSPELESRVLAQLVRGWQAVGNQRLAIYYGKRAVNLYQKMRANFQSLDPATQREFVRSRQDSYRELADLLITQERLAEAQQVLGLLKEEEFLDFVRRDQKTASQLESRLALGQTETKTNAEEEELGSAILAQAREEAELTAIEDEKLTLQQRDRLDAVREQLRSGRRAYREFLAKLPEQFANIETGKLRVEQIKESTAIKDALRALGPDAAALFTVTTAKQYSVIVMTQNGETAFTYPIAADELRLLISRFRAALDDPRLDPRTLAQQLHRIVFCDGQVARALAAGRDPNAQAQTLLWSLDGLLRYVPLGALHNSDDYLLRKYRFQIITLGSVPNLAHPPQTDWRVLAAGVSEERPGFDALTSVPAELRGIVNDISNKDFNSGILPGRVLLNGRFTQSTLAKSLRNAPGYPVVHIASHFATRPGSEADSFLLLGQGTLSLAALQEDYDQLFQGVDLLALSACETGFSGADADGKEVDSFGAIAQRQGARSVIATLWPVADLSTSLLMREFYRFHRAGETKSEALRRAQLALLDGDIRQEGAGANNRGTEVNKARSSTDAAAAFVFDPKKPLAHPYFWAPFILIGNGR